MTYSRYRYTVADGDPTWSRGWRAYKNMYEHVLDRLRFHRGKGFSIDDADPIRLADVEDVLHKRLDKIPPHTIVRVTALLDGYDIKAERLLAEDLKGDEIVGHVINAIGTRYVLGGASLSGMDCSGETLWAHAFEGITLPHNAAMQHDLFRNHAQGFVPITREQVKIGDLIFFHDDDHVAPYAGQRWGMDVVVDAEPHDTHAPAGWPTTYLGTGVRFRPMTGNYYCSWQYANGFGRIVAINGQP